MRKVEMTKEQATEMFYNINSYFITVKLAESIDKTMFKQLRFSNSSMNNHLRKARESIQMLLTEFNRHFRSIDSDIVEYEAPAALYEALEYLSRLHPEQIEKSLNILKNIELKK